jgi:hypothetical protein
MLIKKKLHIGFILIKLLIRLFIFIGYFVFALEKDGLNQNSIIIIKNIGFKSFNIEFDIKFCDANKCENRKTTYLINDTLKSNMDILAFKNLSQKRNDKIFVKRNGIRIMQGDDISSKYYKNIGFLKNNYNDFSSYKDIFLKYLEKNKNIIMSLGGSHPLAYGVYFPKLKGLITIDKIKANDNLYFFKTKMNIAFSPSIIISDFNGDKYNETIIDIDKSLSSDFESMGDKNDLDSLSYDLMQSISSEVAYFLANIEIDEKPDTQIYEESITYLDDVDISMIKYKSSNFITLGINMIPFKVSLGHDYETFENYSDYFNSFSIGYHKNMINWYDVSMNVDIYIGKKDYLIIDKKYSFKNPTLLSINGALSKRIYLNSNIYLAPFIGGSITKISSSEAKGFKDNAFIQDYSAFIGGELGWKIQDNQEIGLWLNKPLIHTSNITEGNKIYNATIKNDISFGLSYRYSF